MAVCLVLAIVPPFQWKIHLPAALDDGLYWASFACWYAPAVGGLLCARYREKLPFLKRVEEFLKGFP
jgi:hypothetical protein